MEEFKETNYGLNFDELLLILENLNVGVIYVDDAGIIRYVNKLAEKIRRMNRDERIGTSVVECHPITSHKKVKDVLAGFKKGEVNHRHRLIRVGENYFDNEYIAVYDKNGDYKGILLVSQDVTEKVKLQRQVEQYYKEMEEGIKRKLSEIEMRYKELMEIQSQLIHSEKMASLGQFVSVVAHEVNNPLDGIKNCLITMYQEPDNVEQTKHYAELAIKAVEKIEGVVRLLLEYARPHKYDMGKLNLLEIVDEAVSLVKYKAERLGIEIVNRVGEEIYIRGSRHHILQVFLNLILNSIDAIVEKRVRDRVDAGRIAIESRDMEKKICVDVSDDGCGISEENLGKIFSPFFTTKSEKGTGLGLYVCYNIVYVHGGSISVKSKKGEGTTFSICLPKYREFYPEKIDVEMFEKLVHAKQILKTLLNNP